MEVAENYLCILYGGGGVAHISNICIVRASSVEEAKDKARALFRVVRESADFISAFPFSALHNRWSYYK